MLIKNLISHIKMCKVIKQIIKAEDLLHNFSTLFSTENYKVNFKQDWVGRIYAIVNPVVQDPQARIFEYDSKGMNINSFIEKWVIEHMIAADNFVKNHQLFDILTYELKPIEDDTDYNFLFTLTPVTWFDLAKSLKRFLWILFGLGIVGIIAAIILAIAL